MKADTVIDGDPPPPPPPPPTLTLSPGFNTAKPTFESIKLHFAINQEDYAAALHEIQCGDNVDFIIHGNTPLMLAMFRRQYDIAKLLIKSSCNVCIPEIYVWKRQPIHLAAMYDESEIVEMLLNNGASLQAADGMRMTPLHWAASYGAYDTVNLLLDRGAHVNARDDRHKTALCRAAACNREDIVQLLHKSGASVNIQDIHGWSPVHEAVFCSLPITECLLKLGTDPNLRDNLGNSALHLMLMRTDYRSLRILASNDLQFYTRDRKLTTTCTQDVHTFLNDRQLLKLLLDYGLDVNLINVQGLTALELSLRNRQFQFAQWLIEAGATWHIPIATYPQGWPAYIVDNVPFCDLVRERFSEPISSLRDLCRWSIRQALYPAISHSISCLPLPSQLKAFLQLELT